RTAAAFATAILLAHAHPLAAQSRTDAGFVLSLSGTWFTSSQPTQPLGLGQPVLEGDSVWAGERAGATNYLNLVLFADDPALGFHCSRPGDCTRRHPILANRPGGLRLGQWLRAVRISLGGGPDRYSVNLTRGVPLPQGDPRPEEAIVIRGPGGVNLAPALDSIKQREVLLCVAALDRAATAHFWEPLRVWLTPGRPALVASAFLPPGLYAIRLVGGQTDPVGVQPDATWVLVMDGTPTAIDDAAAFRELSARLRDLNGGRHDEDTIKVLRATLHHLALRGPAGAAPSSP
ncbi:MAG TPA: hypothetical protein VEX86_24515, partial [Longimicrobium sp.]|nr:hypothetical protein [Longimicrobium sp.]